jgi:hypothetical protein
LNKTPRRVRLLPRSAKCCRSFTSCGPRY